MEFEICSIIRNGPLLILSNFFLFILFPDSTYTRSLLFEIVILTILFNVSSDFLKLFIVFSNVSFLYSFKSRSNLRFSGIILESFPNSKYVGENFVMLCVVLLYSLTHSAAQAVQALFSPLFALHLILFVKRLRWRNG